MPGLSGDIRCGIVQTKERFEIRPTMLSDHHSVIVGFEPISHDPVEAGQQLHKCASLFDHDVARSSKLDTEHCVGDGVSEADLGVIGRDDRLDLHDPHSRSGIGVTQQGATAL